MAWIHGHAVDLLERCEMVLRVKYFGLGPSSCERFVQYAIDYIRDVYVVWRINSFRPSLAEIDMNIRGKDSSNE